MNEEKLCDNGLCEVLYYKSKSGDCPECIDESAVVNYKLHSNHDFEDLHAFAGKTTEVINYTEVIVPDRLFDKYFGLRVLFAACAFILSVLVYWNSF